MFCRVDGQRQDALGANLELRTDARRLWGGAAAAPLSLSASLLSHGGEGLGAVSAAGQVAAGRGKVVGAKLQVGRGRFERGAGCVEGGESEVEVVVGGKLQVGREGDGGGGPRRGRAAVF
jgi:hypothetical protein